MSSFLIRRINGVYYVEGGNTKIAEGFAHFFKKLGGRILNNTEVKQIFTKEKKAKGVLLQNEEIIEGEKVIVNDDLLSSYERLLPEEERPSYKDRKIASYEPSVSAFVMMVALKGRRKNFVHHQVYFSENYQREFKGIFVHKKFPEDPTIYISNSSYSNDRIAPGDNLFILVNAPAITFITKVESENYKEKIYNKLLAYGVDIRKDKVAEKTITPCDIEAKFFARRGALYGISSNRKKDSFLRPSNVSKDIKGLYFVGGTTHPGGGSPMVTISGLNVAHHILNENRKKSSKVF
ncbi:hypothetical protein A3863_25875 [Priestia endophytica]|uniref:Phytoene desaturase n=1 Tax=Priestia endophytica TaxID=135735 RepID=A0AAX1QFG5_9BACI|nr:hypothetical protein A3864_00445 [Priestia endophytica]RAS84627.1 hypothetical protein A3863_25875 [Priestia endophytica]